MKYIFQNNKNLLITKNIDIQVKKNLLKSWKYGSETWTIEKTKKKGYLHSKYGVLEGCL